jgi:acetate kinase
VRVLAINCGSSTLKFAVTDASGGEPSVTHLAAGTVDGIGGDSITSLSVAGHTFGIAKPAGDHGEAFGIAVEVLQEAGALSGIEAVGHRVVHGGIRFREPVLIIEGVIAAIEAASELAPLHNRPAVAVIRAARAYFGDTMPMVATFDTAFYASLPDVATTYALPKELSERLGIQRFGFHGLAHRYMVERYRVLGPETPEPRLITLQLGNGCSITASIGGRPVDTSMGFSPLEGLIMGTRSGDLDPSIPLFLIEKEGMLAAEVEELLNKRSGLLGLSGKSNDIRVLLAAAQDRDPESELAVRAFCYRAKKYLGAYLVVLGGADAVIFGGGIGEHMPEIREAICAGLEWARLELDRERNEAALQSDEPISSGGSEIEVWVVHVDEATVIARDVVDYLRRRIS